MNTYSRDEFYQEHLHFGKYSISKIDFANNIRVYMPTDIVVMHSPSLNVLKFILKPYEYFIVFDEKPSETIMDKLLDDPMVIELEEAMLIYAADLIKLEQKLILAFKDVDTMFRYKLAIGF